MPIWSHTVTYGDKGMLLGYGTESRIIFTTERREHRRRDIVRSSDASVDLALTPRRCSWTISNADNNV